MSKETQLIYTFYTYQFLLYVANFIDTCTNDKRLTVAVHVEFFVLERKSQRVVYMINLN